ncbi:MAG: S8 family peptidase, partial [Thermoplasmatota archaeon]
MIQGRLQFSLAIAAVFVTVALAPLVQSGDAGSPKFDAPLAKEMNGGSLAELRLVVVGYGTPLPAASLDSRAAWSSYWSSAARPFTDEVARLARANHATVTRLFPEVPVAFVSAPRAAVASFAGSSTVKALGLDSDESIHILDAGPGTGPGANGVSTDITVSDSVAMTQAPDLWAMGFRGDGVLIAGIDTGIDSTHPMFSDGAGHSRVARWIDIVNDCPDAPCDLNGHGTHTSSTFAGSDEHGGLYSGMAPHATIMGVKIFKGAGGSGSWEDAQAGLQAAFDNGADVTSDSWGGGCDAGGSATRDLAEALARAGMISVFAAGNSGPSPGSIGCPGDGDMVVTVGAVDSSKVVAGFSSRGPCSDGRICPDVVAVGVNVLAAWPGNNYVSESGTSMATPHVAGAVALLEQVARERRGGSLDSASKEAETILKSTAQDLGPAGPDNDYGWGFIQVHDAANQLLAARGVDLGGSLTLDKNVIRNTG